MTMDSMKVWSKVGWFCDPPCIFGGCLEIWISQSFERLNAGSEARSDSHTEPERP